MDPRRNGKRRSWGADARGSSVKMSSNDVLVVVRAAVGWNEDGGVLI
jgi:hypothetical protein